MIDRFFKLYPIRVFILKSRSDQVLHVYCLHSPGSFQLHRQMDVVIVQSNLNSSNTDGSFTIVNSNSFLSPYEILQIAQENIF